MKPYKPWGISERRLKQLMPRLQRAAERKLEETSEGYCVGNGNLGVGEGQAVIALGEYWIGLKKRSLAGKVSVEGKKVKPDFIGRHFLEHQAEYLRKKRFPIALHKTIKAGGGEKGIILTVTENLKASNNRLEEAHDFDFTKLKNGAALRRQLRAHVARMRELAGKKEIEIYGHRSKDEPDLAFKKTFFIQYDPKTMAGRLVMADIDHIKIRALDRREYAKQHETIQKAMDARLYSAKEFERKWGRKAMELRKKWNKEKKLDEENK
ncbi:hypothetical protein HY993_04755 [Candidatus Micrarchaeota archaeon]|nr:hypothetical protein [Candidatus Micrarchaeota archaeon]